MSRTTYKTIAAVALILLALGAMRNFSLLAVGTGAQFSNSPDGRYSAEVYGYKKQRFWGGCDEWTVLKITSADAHSQPREYSVNGLVDKNTSWNWRDNGRIEWRTDRSVAVFRYHDPALGYEVCFEVEAR